MEDIKREEETIKILYSIIIQGTKIERKENVVVDYFNFVKKNKRRVFRRN